VDFPKRWKLPKNLPRMSIPRHYIAPPAYVAEHAHRKEARGWAPRCRHHLSLEDQKGRRRPSATMPSSSIARGPGGAAATMPSSSIARGCRGAGGNGGGAGGGGGEGARVMSQSPPCQSHSLLLHKMSQTLSSIQWGGQRLGSHDGGDGDDGVSQSPPSNLHASLLHSRSQCLSPI